MIFTSVFRFPWEISSGIVLFRQSASSIWNYWHGLPSFHFSRLLLDYGLLLIERFFTDPGISGLRQPISSIFNKIRENTVSYCIIPAIIFLLAFILRVVDLGTGLFIGEPAWLRRSASFMHALLQGTCHGHVVIRDFHETLPAAWHGFFSIICRLNVDSDLSKIRRSTSRQSISKMRTGLRRCLCWWCSAPSCTLWWNGCSGRSSENGMQLS